MHIFLILFFSKIALAQNTEIYEVALKDLRSQSVSERTQTRYLSLGHIVAEGEKDEVVSGYVNGLQKMANSVSWRKTIKLLTVVDPKIKLLRLNLSDFGWTREQWSSLEREYPFDSVRSSIDLEKMRYETGTAQPILRGDWFLFSIARPPFYHEFLRLPENVLELETLLGLNVSRNIESNKVVRAGFRGGLFDGGSGVSNFNRLIERHDTSFGAYWKSYDFSSNSGFQDLFSYPLGPKSTGEALSFIHAGGEMIFNLPNGLQAYYLSDGKGGRLDRAPVEIVQDQLRPDGVVVNGISCLSCHSQGMRVQYDEILDYAKSNPNAFPHRSFEKILNIYKTKSDLDKYFNIDKARFAEALKKLGILGQSEPISKLDIRFEDPLTFERAAAELDISPYEFESFPSSALKPIVTELKSGGMARDKFIQLFPMIDQILARNLRSSRSDMDIFAAARECNLLKIEFALGRGASVFNRNSGGRLPLHEAIYSRCENEVISTLTNGLDGKAIQQPDFRGDDVLFSAILVQSDLKPILEIGTLDLKKRDRRGLTPLNMALSLGYEEGAIQLLNYTPTVWGSLETCDAQGSCPIHSAVTAGSSRSLEVLLEAPGININLRNGTGTTPFTLARIMVRSNPWNLEFSKIFKMIADEGGAP